MTNAEFRTMFPLKKCRPLSASQLRKVQKWLLSLGTFNAYLVALALGFLFETGFRPKESIPWPGSRDSTASFLTFAQVVIHKFGIEKIFEVLSRWFCA